MSSAQLVCLAGGFAFLCLGFLECRTEIVTYNFAYTVVRGLNGLKSNVAQGLE